MKFNEFQEKVLASMARPELRDDPHYALLGIGGETGEVTQEVQRIPKGGISEYVRTGLAFELGDVLWYLALFSSSVGISLEESAACESYVHSVRKKRDTFGSFQHAYWEENIDLRDATLMLCRGTNQIQEEIKKHIRDDGDPNTFREARRERVIKALFEALRGAANVASYAGLSLDDVAEMGLEKALEARERILSKAAKEE